MSSTDISDNLGDADSNGELYERTLTALDALWVWGGTSDPEERAWLIDRVTRALLADDYERWVQARRAFGPWHEGKRP